MSDETRKIGDVEIRKECDGFDDDLGTEWFFRWDGKESCPAIPESLIRALWDAAAPHRKDGEGDAVGTLRTMVGKLWEWHRDNYKLAFPLTSKEWGDLERILDSAVPVLCAQPPASDTETRRVVDTGPKLPRVVDSGPTVERVDPEMVGDALGAEPASDTEDRDFLDSKRHLDETRQRVGLASDTENIRDLAADLSKPGMPLSDTEGSADAKSESEREETDGAPLEWGTPRLVREMEGLTAVHYQGRVMTPEECIILLVSQRAAHDASIAAEARRDAKALRDAAVKMCEDAVFGDDEGLQRAIDSLDSLRAEIAKFDALAASPEETT